MVELAGDQQGNIGGRHRLAERVGGVDADRRAVVPVRRGALATGRPSATIGGQQVDHPSDVGRGQHVDDRAYPKPVTGGGEVDQLRRLPLRTMGRSSRRRQAPSLSRIEANPEANRASAVDMSSWPHQSAALRPLTG